jgi:hypothetical protein
MESFHVHKEFALKLLEKLIVHAFEEMQEIVVVQQAKEKVVQDLVAKPLAEFRRQLIEDDVGRYSGSSGEVLLTNNDCD